MKIFTNKWGRKALTIMAAAVTLTGAVGTAATVTTTTTPVSAAAPKTGTYAWFAAQNYKGKQVVTINSGKSTFTKTDLSTKSGAWQKFGNLDHYNRVTPANAMLNYKLMPKTARTEISSVSPTGWHNKKLKSGYLYNRSHLIGFQLTGQNANWKNLMTGTTSLNTPGMEHYENILAAYLKAHRYTYIRYRVEPVFRGKELLARGVHMMAQSVGTNAVHFNVYIFNVQSGVSLNYATGYSTGSGVAVKAPAKKAPVKKAPVKKAPVKKVVVKKAVVKKAVAKKVATGTNGIPLTRTVYVVPGGTVFHLNRKCSSLRRSKHVISMSLKTAMSKGYKRECKLEY